MSDSFCFVSVSTIGLMFSGKFVLSSTTSTSLSDDTFGHFFFSDLCCLSLFFLFSGFGLGLGFLLLADEWVQGAFVKISSRVTGKLPAHLEVAEVRNCFCLLLETDGLNLKHFVDVYRRLHGLEALFDFLHSIFRFAEDAAQSNFCSL